MFFDSRFVYVVFDIKSRVLHHLRPVFETLGLLFERELSLLSRAPSREQLRGDRVVRGVMEMATSFFEDFACNSDARSLRIILYRLR